MAKSKNSKLRMFRLLEFLQRRTDAEHGVSMQQILDYLASLDIPAERKTIYEDLQLFRDALGYDIEAVNSPHTEYRLLSRELEQPELRLLVDAVCASRFITQKKSASLVKKLEALTSDRGQRELSRQVYVEKRVKSMNESVYINIDAIHNAINNRVQITFIYFDYDTHKKRVPRHGGGVYRVNPLALLYSDENYYLAAYNDARRAVNNYRVDRMTEVGATEAPFSEAAQNTRFDVAEYAAQQFSMYGGTKEQVRIEFDAMLVNAVIDRFGADVTLVPQPDGGFALNAAVELSPTFFGWVFQFGGRARITSPQSAVEGYSAQLKKALEGCK